jgi:hypothetical protein
LSWPCHPPSLIPKLYNSRRGSENTLSSSFLQPRIPNFLKEEQENKQDPLPRKNSALVLALILTENKMNEKGRRNCWRSS